jgi:O-antigen/teichoic acid export membrane protein
MSENIATSVSLQSKASSLIRRLHASKLVNGFAAPGLRLGGAFLQFLATILIARVLGESGAGDFFFWAAVLMALSEVSTFGMDRLALQQIPRLDGDAKALSAFLAPVRGITMILSLTVGLILILYATLVQTEIERSLWWYALLPVGLASVAMCRINGEAAKGLGRPLMAVIYRHLTATSVFFLLLLIIGSRLTPETALACFVAGFLLSGSFATKGPGFRELGRHIRLPDRREIRSKFVVGLPIFVCAVFSAVTYIVPLSVLERSHVSADVAHLTTAYRLFMLFGILGQAVHSLAMPRLSRVSHEEDWHRAIAVYRGSTLQGLAILGLPIIVVFVAAEQVMALFGEGFVTAVPVLRAFLAFQLISLCLGPARELVLMMGDTAALARFSLYRAIATVGISLLVIPAYGPLGMATAVGGTAMLESVACLWHFKTRSARRKIERGEK